jgi:hypothetical protein
MSSARDQSPKSGFKKRFHYKPFGVDLNKWIVPACVAVVILTTVGWWTHTTVEEAISVLIILFVLAIVVALFCFVFRLIRKESMKIAVKWV